MDQSMTRKEHRKHNYSCGFILKLSHLCFQSVEFFGIGNKEYELRLKIPNPEVDIVQVLPTFKFCKPSSAQKPFRQNMLLQTESELQWMWHVSLSKKLHEFGLRHTRAH
jgi:hypothetical protein